ncbi:uncharacterized protein N7500_001950 [Penicillium coprophilum]|uniref:uncharacterized protein n=1 Tax=Penicillium coprophilum TaxID=36646 RepID=UPI002384949D|nr:uncharacterized protein N7500_001950 [Penicillium coprophilum]KAJ5174019.1 hypothetical protein N7500_001950 [Penicillium coprophilum]
MLNPQNRNTEPNDKNPKKEVMGLSTSHLVVNPHYLPTNLELVGPVTTITVCVPLFDILYSAKLAFSRCKFQHSFVHLISLSSNGGFTSNKTIQKHKKS